MKDRFKPTSCYGLIPFDKIQFRDSDLFEMEMWTYEMLTKIKLWYGTPKSGDNDLKNKIVLGIQCTYKNTLTGKITVTEPHCGDLSKNDIEVKELELKDNDYFNKFYIDADMAVYHVKLITKNEESIEVGTENEEYKKTVLLNLDKEPNMIQSFFGYYNIYGLRSLGCEYISKKDFILISLMGIFRLRHLFKKNEEQRQKWENPEELNKLNDKMKAIARLCLLPDKTFSSVIQFYGI